MSATLLESDLSCSQYLFVMLHLQSLQLASLRTFSLTLVLCLVKLNQTHNNTISGEKNKSNSVMIVI